MNHLVWFRNDLRVSDNPALYFAMENLKLKNNETGRSGKVFALFSWTENQWREKHFHGDNYVSWLKHNLLALKSQLDSLKISLVIIKQDSFKGLEKSVLELAEFNNISEIYFNDQVGEYEQQRDIAVQNLLESKQIKVNRFFSETLLPPGTVKTLEGSIHKVFTPFKKSFAKVWLASYQPPLPIPQPQQSKGRVTHTSHSSDAKWLSQYKLVADAESIAKSWKAGEQVAQEKLENFLHERAASYNLERDLPFIDGTSSLSPYFNVGALSIKQAFLAAFHSNQGQLLEGNDGLVTWISELIWREFYKHLLVGYPELNRNQPMKGYTKRIPWNTSESHLQKWIDGETGYPIVDAAMKQLKSKGWMHNRLRMVVASFFCKHLFLDWRLGEKYFMSQLIDGDFSANNGGWQWSASTGADAAPYFRMFNPIRQSEKFDPNGEFIKHYIDALAPMDSKQIHMPSDEQRLHLSYPKAIVDHKVARDNVMKQFKKYSEANS